MHAFSSAPLVEAPTLPRLSWAGLRTLDRTNFTGRVPYSHLPCAVQRCDNQSKVLVRVVHVAKGPEQPIVTSTFLRVPQTHVRSRNLAQVLQEDVLLASSCENDLGMPSQTGKIGHVHYPICFYQLFS